MEPQYERREYALKKIGISLGITYMEWKMNWTWATLTKIGVNPSREFVAAIERSKGIDFWRMNGKESVRAD